jgi:hypothetical protein
MDLEARASTAEMASPTRPAPEPGGKGERTSPHAAEFAACIVTAFLSRPRRLYLLRLSNGVDQVGVRNRPRFPVAPLEPLHLLRMPCGLARDLPTDSTIGISTETSGASALSGAKGMRTM